MSDLEKMIDEAMGSGAQEMYDAARAAIDRVAELEGELKDSRAEVERLRDGLYAIQVYGSDTRIGPTKDSDNTMVWQRNSVIEMTNRAIRVLRGDPWEDESKAGGA